MSGHTPGPWVADLSGAIFGPDGAPIQTCGEYAIQYGNGTKEALANSYLIAAAPDLLVAAKAMIGPVNLVGAADALGMLRAAVEKAEGKGTCVLK